MRYTVVLTPEPDGSAVNVSIPAMPGVHTWGRTEAEALDSAQEAIALHLEGYAERGLPAPPDRRPRQLPRLGRPPQVPRAPSVPRLPRLPRMPRVPRVPSLTKPRGHRSPGKRVVTVDVRQPIGR